MKAIKKANEVTSEQILAWARRVEAQRAQKAITEATKEIKEFDSQEKSRAQEQYIR